MRVWLNMTTKSSCEKSSYTMTCDEEETDLTRV